MLKIDLTPQLKKLEEEIGERCLEAIKANAPKKTGLYAASWKWKTIKEAGGPAVVLYSDHPKRKTLTHILELGHLTKPSIKGFGKGKQWFVSAQPHIKPAVDAYKPIYLKN